MPGAAVPNAQSPLSKQGGAGGASNTFSNKPLQGGPRHER